MPYVNRFDGTFKSHKQWIRENGAEMMEDAEDWGEITKVPTLFRLKCQKCGHKGTAKVPQGRPWKFRCSKCGSNLSRCL